MTSETSSSYVACRTLGHAWDSIPVPRSEAPSGGGLVGLWLRCTRCTTERHDVVQLLSGLVDGRRYVYPDGYQRSREDSLARDDWRKQYLRLIGSGTRKRRERQSA